MANKAVDRSAGRGKEADGPLRPEETQVDDRPGEEEDGRAQPLARPGEGQADPSPH